MKFARLNVTPLVTSCRAFGFDSEARFAAAGFLQFLLLTLHAMMWQNTKTKKPPWLEA